MAVSNKRAQRMYNDIISFTLIWESAFGALALDSWPFAIWVLCIAFLNVEAGRKMCATRSLRKKALTAIKWAVPNSIVLGLCVGLFKTSWTYAQIGEAKPDICWSKIILLAIICFYSWLAFALARLGALAVVWSGLKMEERQKNKREEKRRGHH